MKISYSNIARKNLRKLDVKTRNAILNKLEVFAETGRGDVKKLQGCTSQYRLRHSDWRAIFEMENDILVLKVVKRGKAYKR